MYFDGNHINWYTMHQNYDCHPEVMDYVYYITADLY